IYETERLRRRAIHLDAAKGAAELNETGKKLESLSEELSKEAPFLEQKLTERALDGVKGHQSALESVYGFYNGYDPDFTWWMEKPYAKIMEQLKAYSEIIMGKVDEHTLSKDDGSGIVGSPVGAEELKNLLEDAFIPYSAEE